IAFLLLAITAVVVLPVALEYASRIGLRTPGWTVEAPRWPALFAAVTIGIALIYRFGPSREKAQGRWVSWGSALAALSWLAGSMLFSWYAANFGSYNATYGSLGAVIGFMTWIWLSTVVILLGAEINAEMEHQTTRDTTTGAPRPMGERGAVMADTVGAA